MKVDTSEIIIEKRKKRYIFRFNLHGYCDTKTLSVHNNNKIIVVFKLCLDRCIL